MKVLKNNNYMDYYHISCNYLLYFDFLNDGENVTDDNIVGIVRADNQVEIHMKELDTTQQYNYILEYKH